MLDYGLTIYAISSGIAKEANPFLSWMSLEFMGIFKTFWVCVWVYRYYARPRMLDVGIVFFVAVCIWNTIIIW